MSRELEVTVKDTDTGITLATFYTTGDTTFGIERSERKALADRIKEGVKEIEDRQT